MELSLAQKIMELSNDAKGEIAGWDFNAVNTKFEIVTDKNKITFIKEFFDRDYIDSVDRIIRLLTEAVLYDWIKEENNKCKDKLNLFKKISKYSEVIKELDFDLPKKDKLEDETEYYLEQFNCYKNMIDNLIGLLNLVSLNLTSELSSIIASYLDKNWFEDNLRDLHPEIYRY
jgi:putative cell wall-binding protein